MRVEPSPGVSRRPSHPRGRRLRTWANCSQSSFPTGPGPSDSQGPPTLPSSLSRKPGLSPSTWSRTYPGKDYKASTPSTTTPSAGGHDRRDARSVEGAPRPEIRGSAKKGRLLPDGPDAGTLGRPSSAVRRRHAPSSCSHVRALDTGLESQSAIKTLLELYRDTGEANYLEPILAPSPISSSLGSPRVDLPGSTR